MRSWLAQHTSFASCSILKADREREMSQPTPHNSIGPSQDTLYTGLPHRSIDFALAKGVQKIWYQWPPGCLLFSCACCCILLLSVSSQYYRLCPMCLHSPSKILVWKLPLDDYKEYNNWFQTILKARKPAFVVIDERGLFGEGQG